MLYMLLEDVVADGIAVLTVIAATTRQSLARIFRAKAFSGDGLNANLIVGVVRE